MSVRSEMTAFIGELATKGDLHDFENKLDLLQKRQLQAKQGLKSAGDIFLIWESGGEFSKIAIFSEN